MTGKSNDTDEIRNSKAAREARSIIKFMIEHTAYGGIYSLAMASRDAPIFIMLLFFGLFITFGGISLGIGIMNLGGFSDNDNYDDERKKHRDDRNGS